MPLCLVGTYPHKMSNNWASNLQGCEQQLVSRHRENKQSKSLWITGTYHQKKYVYPMKYPVHTGCIAFTKPSKTRYEFDTKIILARIALDTRGLAL